MFDILKFLTRLCKFSQIPLSGNSQKRLDKKKTRQNAEVLAVSLGVFHRDFKIFFDLTGGGEIEANDE